MDGWARWNQYTLTSNFDEATGIINVNRMDYKTRWEGETAMEIDHVIYNAMYDTKEMEIYRGKTRWK